MKAEWRPLFWEPVEGTGERLMAGVVGMIEGNAFASRILRDDVFDALYGSASGNPRKMIDHALRLGSEIVAAGGHEALKLLEQPVFGLHPGKLRITDAHGLQDVLRQASLMHSSLASLDGLEVDEEEEHVNSEDGNRRFTREVREAVLEMKPHLRGYFGRRGALRDGGSLVKFGFLSDAAVFHFSVLHPVRQPSSVRFARAKLWELARARDHSGLSVAALITAVPNDADPTLGEKQREHLKEHRADIEREADSENLRFMPVVSVSDAKAAFLAELR